MIDWMTDWDAALAKSGETGTPVFAFLYAVG